MSLVIVNTGCANISSVYFAFKRLGVDAVISHDPTVIKQADRVILPGVGTAHNAMHNIHKTALADTLRHLEQPLLGICLGMQLLTSHSAEGHVDCLNIIPASVKPLPDTGLRLPHMGWNTLHTLQQHPLLQGISIDDYFYFVHSFAVETGSYTLANCQYGSNFSAIIGQNNVAGAQFHPERSGKAGARLLQNFLEWKL